MPKKKHIYTHTDTHTNARVSVFMRRYVSVFAVRDCVNFKAREPLAFSCNKEKQHSCNFRIFYYFNACTVLFVYEPTKAHLFIINVLSLVHILTYLLHGAESFLRS